MYIPYRHPKKIVQEQDLNKFIENCFIFFCYKYEFFFTWALSTILIYINLELKKIYYCLEN